MGHMVVLLLVWTALIPPSYFTESYLILLTINAFL